MTTPSASIADLVTEVPPNLGPISLDGYRRLVALIEAELTERGLVPFSLDAGAVRVLTPERRDERWYLDTLARQCDCSTPDRWPGIVRAFLDRSAAPSEILVEAVERAQDFTHAAEHLVVRLYPAEVPKMKEDDSVEREAAPGIRAVLALDLGDAVVHVGEELARSWAVPLHELFERAARNVAEHTPVESSHTEPLPGARLVTLYGSRNTVSSHVLSLGRHLPADATRGALVVVPARHMLVFHVIRDAAMLDAVRALRLLAEMMYAREPGPISRSIYWYHAGKLELVRLKQVGGVAALAGPHALVTIATRLSRR